MPDKDITTTLLHSASLLDIYGERIREMDILWNMQSDSSTVVSALDHPGLEAMLAIMYFCGLDMEQTWNEIRIHDEAETAWKAINEVYTLCFTEETPADPITPQGFAQAVVNKIGKNGSIIDLLKAAAMGEQAFAQMFAPTTTISTLGQSLLRHR